MVTSVHVTINGFEYNLKGKESEEYLKHVASFVEGKVQEIMSKNKSLTMVGAVTLAAVNIADESFKGNKEYNDILAELEEIERENKKLKEELEECEIGFIPKDWNLMTLGQITTQIKEKVGKNNYKVFS